MRILMCLTSLFPPDIRIEKEAISLAQAGHKVHVLSHFIAGRPAEEDMGYAVILRHMPPQSFPERA